MTELIDDYSGPYIDSVVIEQFSHEFVCNLAKEWQVSASKEYEICFKWIEKNVSKEAAEKFDEELWGRAADVIWPRIERVAKIEVTDIVEALKVGQIILEGAMAWQPLNSLEIIDGNKNHVIWTAKRCLNLEYFEKYDKSRIPNMCGPGGIEEISFRKLLGHYFTDCEVKPLILPPPEGREKGSEEIACRWELKSSGIRKKLETKTRLF